MERFFLSSDNDGHWYVVSVSIEEEWYKWLDLGDDDPPEYPEGARPVGGAPSLITFTDPCP